VKDLIEHLGLNTVVLAGHDWGALITWNFATRWPERLKAVIALVLPRSQVPWLDIMSSSVSLSNAYNPPLPERLSPLEFAALAPEALGYWFYVATDQAAVDMESRVSG
jgi:pimeloyl-ACP methyl ester carboxylesterase